MSSDNIGDEGAEFVTADNMSVVNKTLQRIELENNNKSDKGAEILLDLKTKMLLANQVKDQSEPPNKDSAKKTS